jgi:UDP-2,4-diacetamido-2,4,6-trideoxy-beta-L-altropyranose hydrolase
MNIAIRVDASSEIGTGHFMRCLTLAAALKQRGERVRFVSRHLPEYLQDMLAEKNLEFSLIGTRHDDVILDELAHARWLGVSQSQDAVDTIQALSDVAWEWLIVDHYALDSRWESKLRDRAKKILAIDDIADRQHDCDLLLDQNLYADMETRYNGKVPIHCQLLLGPRYALLRDEFRKQREQTKPRSGSVKRVLVFFGGIDVNNCTASAIDALAGMDIFDLHVDVVIGALHPRREKIQTVCQRLGYFCHVQTERMAELMADADLAIGAGGSASWERCCLCLPALLVALADNQILIAKALDSYGACVYLGTSNTVTSEIMQEAIVSLLNTRSQIKILSEKACSLVDGSGVHRVCQEVGC